MRLDGIALLATMLGGCAASISGSDAADATRNRPRVERSDYSRVLICMIGRKPQADSYDVLQAIVPFPGRYVLVDSQPYEGPGGMSCQRYQLARRTVKE